MCVISLLDGAVIGQHTYSVKDPNPQTYADSLLVAGVARRDAAEVADWCRYALLTYSLPLATLMAFAFSALEISRDGALPPTTAGALVVSGLSLVARYRERFGLGSAVFLIGNFLCIGGSAFGLADGTNGLVNGAAYALCFFPLLGYACAKARWQRIASAAAPIAMLLGVYAVGRATHETLPLSVVDIDLGLVRGLTLMAVSLGVAYGFDRAIVRAHGRLDRALVRQLELNETLDGNAQSLAQANARHRDALARLHRSDQRYRYLFANAFDGIAIFDADRGCAEEVNETLANRLGYTPEELLPLSPLETSPSHQPDGRPSGEVLAETMAAIQAEGSHRYSWRHVTTSGEPVDYEIQTVVVGGDGTQYVSMLRDVTDRLRAERDLERANQELKSFAHAASHDLKEPLRTMSNFARLLDRRYADQIDDRGREYLGFITDAAQRGTTLVNDLLRYAVAGVDEVELERVDLKRIGDSVAATVAARLREEGARLELGPLPEVQATPTWAQQLLQNLISNALKFKRPGVPPVVKISSRTTASRYAVDVADNGIGIAEDDLGRVFGIFERLVRRDQYEGSGIGLALCRRIMLRIGGDISVASVLGEGTTFTLHFPRQPVARERATVGSTAATAAELATSSSGFAEDRVSA